MVEVLDLPYSMTVEHPYPDFHLTIHAYTCTLKVGEVTLKEDVSAQWLVVEELNQLDWTAADSPVVSYLSDQIN